MVSSSCVLVATIKVFIVAKIFVVFIGNKGLSTVNAVAISIVETAWYVESHLSKW